MEAPATHSPKRHLSVHEGGLPGMARRPSLGLTEATFEAARGALARSEHAREEFSSRPADWTRTHLLTDTVAFDASLGDVLPGVAQSSHGRVARPGIGVTLRQVIYCGFVLGYATNCKVFVTANIIGASREPMIDVAPAHEGAL